MIKAYAKVITVLLISISFSNVIDAHAGFKID